jgi:hypothetical protein
MASCGDAGHDGGFFGSAGGRGVRDVGEPHFLFMFVSFPWGAVPAVVVVGLHCGERGFYVMVRLKVLFHFHNSGAGSGNVDLRDYRADIRHNFGTRYLLFVV